MEGTAPGFIESSASPTSTCPGRFDSSANRRGGGSVAAPIRSVRAIPRASGGRRFRWPTSAGHREVEARGPVTREFDRELSNEAPYTPALEGIGDDDLGVGLGAPPSQTASSWPDERRMPTAVEVTASRPPRRAGPLVDRWPSCTACSMTDSRSSAPSHRARSNAVRARVVRRMPSVRWIVSAVDGVGP